MPVAPLLRMLPATPQGSTARFVTPFKTAPSCHYTLDGDSHLFPPTLCDIKTPKTSFSLPFTGTFLSAGCTAKGALFCSFIHFLSFVSLPHMPPTSKPSLTSYENRSFHFHSVICLPHLGDFPANCITLFGQLAYKLIFLYK